MPLPLGLMPVDSVYGYGEGGKSRIGLASELCGGICGGASGVDVGEATRYEIKFRQYLSSRSK